MDAPPVTRTTLVLACSFWRSIIFIILTIENCLGAVSNKNKEWKKKPSLKE